MQHAKRPQRQMDDRSEPGVIVPSTESNNDWPETNDVINAVTVSYVTGYVDAASVPADIKQWIKLQVGMMYEFREPAITGTIISNQTRGFIDGLLDRHIIMSIPR